MGFKVIMPKIALLILTQSCNHLQNGDHYCVHFMTLSRILVIA